MVQNLLRFFAQSKLNRKSIADAHLSSSPHLERGSRKKARLDKSSIKVLRAAYLVGVLIKISISLIQKFTE